GIRDGHVTGVQTCALPISVERQDRTVGAEDVITTLDLDLGLVVHGRRHAAGYEPAPDEVVKLVLVRGEVSADRLRGPADVGWPRSEERRVGKEGMSGWWQS